MYLMFYGGWVGDLPQTGDPVCGVDTIDFVTRRMEVEPEQVFTRQAT